MTNRRATGTPRRRPTARMRTRTRSWPPTTGTWPSSTRTTAGTPADPGLPSVGGDLARDFRHCRPIGRCATMWRKTRHPRRVVRCARRGGPMTSIPGASVWEQELYDNLARHVRTEGDIIDDYRRLAAETSSEAFRYLARLIVEDEERHHRFFAELTETVQAFSQLQTEGQPVPFLTSGGADGEELGARTEH